MEETSLASAGLETQGFELSGYVGGGASSASRSDLTPLETVIRKNPDVLHGPRLQITKVANRWAGLLGCRGDGEKNKHLKGRQAHSDTCFHGFY